MSSMKNSDISPPALSDIWAATKKFPEARWDDALSKGQLISKIWLVRNLEKFYSGKHFKCVFVLAGWYGLLGRFLLDECENVSLDKVRSFDLDPTCEAIADSINRTWVIKDWAFKAATEDILKIDYKGHCYFVKNSRQEEVKLIETPDLIVNTSCEHIVNFENWFRKLPEGIPLVLQSNDDDQRSEHINCVKNVDEFLDRAPMKKILFKGTLDLKEYKRFMLMGSK